MNVTSYLWKTLETCVRGTFMDLRPYMLLVLNRPINLPEDYMIELWNNASVRTAVDGGADHWYTYLSTIQKKSSVYPINFEFISGDFDSIRGETLQYCRGTPGAVVLQTQGHNNDLTSTLEEIKRKFGHTIPTIIVVGENSGRLDHTMSNLNNLYNDSFNALLIFMLSSEGMTWLLKAGSHLIHVPQSLVASQAPCGLIPLGYPCIVTTSGLTWDFNKTLTQFGGFLCTSNSFKETSDGYITIETDAPLLMTVNLGFGS